MPGGFTWADAFAGFSQGVVAGMSFGAWFVAIAVVVIGTGLLVGTLLHRTEKRSKPLDPKASIRAMAHERAAKHEALPYDIEAPFTGRADWPKNSNRIATRR